MQSSPGTDQKSIDENAKPGEIITLSTGEKRVVGIDGETFPYVDTGPLDLMPRLDEDDLPDRDNVIRIQKGGAVKVQFTTDNLGPCLIVRHRWHGGLNPVCPKLTAQELIAEADRGRDCPLCGLLDPIEEWFIPVILHARRRPGAGWEPTRSQAKILRVNERMFRHLKKELSRMGDEFKLIIAGREEDEFGSYYIEATNEPFKANGELAAPRLAELRVEPHDDLVKFAESVF
jgi:hypothetical protein